ncbi:GNAT family N-acetyltransferase [Faecalibacterium sp. 9]|uniref:GNAT family N-acetyltransferase n=1 Tax=Faecalibacterium sp. 9 TaxID=3402018 RepID=UPI003AAB90E7
MEYKRFGSKILVRIDKDEEILEKVKELALKEKIRLAAVQALGATNSFTVGVYNVAEKKYYANTFSGSFEIVSLTGTINTMNGEFYTHLHMSAGNDKGEVFGGHLNRAVVSATCEMVVDVLDGTVDRAYDPVTGLNLFKFPSVKENDCAESVLKESKMKIRKAEEKDIPRLLALLGQVLQIHAEIRPDIFISGTTKYTVGQLAELLKQEDKPIYVAVDEDDVCMGYAFCQLKEQPFSTNMVPFKSLFIDDLCVDRQARGQHIGESLFEYVKQQAKELGCYEVTLNVWAGNTPAEHFYEKMGMKTKERQMEYIL